jgi:hypothetical protein
MCRFIKNCSPLIFQQFRPNLFKIISWRIQTATNESYFLYLGLTVSILLTDWLAFFVPIFSISQDWWSEKYYINPDLTTWKNKNEMWWRRTIHWHRVPDRSMRNTNDIYRVRLWEKIKNNRISASKKTSDDKITSDVEKTTGYNFPLIVIFKWKKI